MNQTIDWNEPGLIPELLYFENGNSFTGSVNSAGEKEYRYRLSPGSEKAGDGTVRKFIRAEAWYGPYCYEKSTAEASAEFPLDEAGRSGAIGWLDETYRKMIVPDGEK